MPSIAAIGSENTESTSESMCAVVKGYPLVIRNSDSPEKQWGIPFDAPLFYWYRDGIMPPEIVPSAFRASRPSVVTWLMR